MTHIIHTLEDMTELVNLRYKDNVATQRADELATNVQIMEADNRWKEEFLCTLSHELRTPMHIIHGWVDLLHNKALDPSEYASVFAILNRNTTAQIKMIDELLEASRVLTGRTDWQIGPAHFSPIVATAIDTLALAATNKGLKVSSQLEASVDTVNGDRTRLQQAVNSILANAIKFSEVGGTITIHLSAQNGTLELKISDSGQGIPAEFLPRLFCYFTQEHTGNTRKHGGLGLNLALAHHILELHGGSITAESAGKGHGATFRLEIPLSNLPVIEPEVFRTSSRPLGKRTARKKPGMDSTVDPAAFMWRKSRRRTPNIAH